MPTSHAYVVHLFAAPLGVEHAHRALCGALRDVEIGLEAVVVAWDHPEMCPACVRKAPGAEGVPVPARVPRAAMRHPAAVIDLAARRRGA